MSAVAGDAGARVEFLRRLRQVRTFLPEPVSVEALRDVLEVGRWSGSASNTQPVEIVVVQDAGDREQLAAGGANTARTAPVALVLVTPGAEDRFELDVFDEGRLCERLMLAAAAHGLGSGVAWLKGDGPEAVKRLLGIPAERRVRTVVAIGHPDPAAAQSRTRPAAARKPAAAFAHRDRY
jgi:nitroreductase